MVPRRLRAPLDERVRHGRQRHERGRIAALAARQAEAGTGGVVGSVTRLGRCVGMPVAAGRGAGAIRRAGADARRVVRAVARLDRLIDDPVAAARRGRGAALHERDLVADRPIGTDHLREEGSAFDRHPREVVHRLGMRREGARADRVHLLPAAAGGDVHRALSRRDDLVGVERLRPLVAVLVRHEDQVDAVRVEERDEVRADGQVAAVLGAARIDGVVEHDDLPGCRGRREVVIQEDVLRASGLGDRIAVQDDDVGIARVERIVVLAAGGVVRRGVEGVAPRRAARRLDVVIAEARPEDEVADDVAVGREERGVEVLRRARVVDHVAGVEDEIGRRLQHRVADGQLGRAVASGVAEDEEADRPIRVVGPEHRFGAERDAVGERRVGICRSRQEAIDRDRADRSDAARPQRREPVQRANGERARRRHVGVPDDGHRLPGQELQVRTACQARGHRGRRHRERENDQQRAPRRAGARTAALAGSHAAAMSRPRRRSREVLAPRGSNGHATRGSVVPR